MFEISLQQLVDFSISSQIEIDVPELEESLLDPYKPLNEFDSMHLKDDIEWLKENDDDSYQPLELLYKYMEVNGIDECCITPE